MKRIIVQDRFAPEAAGLRRQFEARFRNPRRAGSGRFVWDYWHVPGQYTHLRTPAWEFFSKKEYEKLHRRIVLWGREKLGCHDISPPWLSCYLEGHEQSLHGDLPHGPWAFVFSLTRWETREFEGGETFLMKEPVLDYWSRRARGLGRKGLEGQELFEEVAPVFNRLTVFDPRVPHGVRRIRGPVQDVCEGRLVIHGWFVNPRPFVEGALPVEALSEGISAQELALHQALQGASRVDGWVSLRLVIAADGRVRSCSVLSDTLRSDDPALSKRVEAAMRKHWLRWRFPRSRGGSRATVPVAFSPG